MTEVIKRDEIVPDIGAGSLAEGLNETGNQPRVLRIRAGEVHVELEWPMRAGSPQAFSVPEENIVSPQEFLVREPAEATGLFDLCAPTVGTFYLAPEPGAAPFVTEGDLVRAGQQVGIVEAMKLMIPIEAERDGQVVAVLAANGRPVEYGDRLFTFATTSID